MILNFDPPSSKSPEMVSWCHPRPSNRSVSDCWYRYLRTSRTPPTGSPPPRTCWKLDTWPVALLGAGSDGDGRGGGGRFKTSSCSAATYYSVEGRDGLSFGKVREKGISGNYERPYARPGNFRLSRPPKPLRDGRGGWPGESRALRTILPKSSCFPPTDPGFLFNFFFRLPRLTRLSRLPDSPRRVFMCFFSSFFFTFVRPVLRGRTPRGRAPPVRIICFYRRDRTSERFNFTRITTKKKKTSL